MTRSRSLVLTIAAVLLAGLLAACGSSSSSTGSSGSSSAAAAGGGSSGAGGGTTILIKNFAFSPKTITVKAGTKVTFMDEDAAAPHTATSTGTGPKTINSPKLTKGKSYTVTFTKPGTYPYNCTIHPFMTGTITVT